ncbi:uncharacterized protein LOC142569548 [Dermacentor variabilis]|uniref:uncharacterized protein LOC142569548 n=1 Tax=Dermacentor variabilis TaxID=34621 RepID=UPI003F5C18A0
MTGHGFRHAAQRDDTCGGTRTPATVSAHGYSRAQLSGRCTKRGWRPGILPSRGCPLSAFLRQAWPRAFVNRTADSVKHRQRVGPRHCGRGSAGAISAWLLAASAATNAMTHRRRNKLAAGTACHPRRSLHQPRVVKASAHRLTIAGALVSPGHSSSGGAWHKRGVPRFECTHSFCMAGSARGAEGPAVMAFDAPLPSSLASPTGACREDEPSSAVLTVAE